MNTTVSGDRLGELADLEREAHIFKWFLHGPSSKGTQVAPSFSTTTVALGASQAAKHNFQVLALINSMQNVLTILVDLLFRLFLAPSDLW